MKLNKEVLKNRKIYPEKVIQFGEGNFLRAFADWTIDRLNKEADFAGNVAVIQPIPKGLVNMLNEQDGLYTLYLEGIKEGKPTKENILIESISRGINPYEQFDAYFELAKSKDLRFMISNTTEAGITYDPDDTLEMKPQKSFPGKVTAFLYERFKAFNGAADKGLIILPCELIDKNGTNLKRIILQYCEKWNLEEKFVTWLENANTFCNTLVDRIVPGYPKDKIEEITKELGYEDNLVVQSAQYYLWVIEGPQTIRNEFPTQKLGMNVLYVDDLSMYRERKVGILNGAHTCMTPVGYLYGIDTVKEAVEDEVVGTYIDETIKEEIIPTLKLTKEELLKYADETLIRFKNPYIKHFLISISLNSMFKFKTRVLPSILKYKEQIGELPKRMVFAFAALIAFYKGDRNGAEIKLNDSQEILNLFKTLWTDSDGSEEAIKNIVKVVLSYKQNWDKDLNEVEGLTDLVAKYLLLIERLGTKKALQQIMGISK